MIHISSNENRKRKNPKEVKILKHSNKQKDYNHHQKTICNQLNLQRKLPNKDNRTHQKVVSNHEFRNFFSVFSLEHMPGQSVNNHFHDPMNNIALQRGQH